MMKIEQGKRYITLRMICGDIVITPMIIIFEPNLDRTFTAITYLKVQEDGEPMDEKEYIFLDSCFVKPLNEHCTKLASGFYIVDSKQMALQTLYHLCKRRFNIGERKTPFIQNLFVRTDSRYMQDYYRVYLNKLKRITM